MVSIVSNIFNNRFIEILYSLPVLCHKSIDDIIFSAHEEFILVHCQQSRQSDANVQCILLTLILVVILIVFTNNVCRLSELYNTSGVHKIQHFIGTQMEEIFISTASCILDWVTVQSIVNKVRSTPEGSSSGASPSIAFATALGLFILFLLLTNYLIFPFFSLFLWLLPNVLLYKHIYLQVSSPLIHRHKKLFTCSADINPLYLLLLLSALLPAGNPHDHPASSAPIFNFNCSHDLSPALLQVLSTLFNFRRTLVAKQQHVHQLILLPHSMSGSYMPQSITVSENGPMSPPPAPHTEDTPPLLPDIFSSNSTIVY